MDACSVVMVHRNHMSKGGICIRGEVREVEGGGDRQRERKKERTSAWKSEREKREGEKERACARDSRGKQTISEGY